MDNDEIRQRIAELVDQQHALRQTPGGPGDAERSRLAALDIEQDRLWDLLRQRDALRDAGADPGQAHERPASEVENYRQ